MSKTRKPLQIAMASQFGGDGSYGNFLGVIDYLEHTDHIQLVGELQRPVSTFEELDLSSLDGVIGFFRAAEHADRIIASGIKAVNFSNGFQDIAMPRVGHDDEAIGQMGATYLLKRGFVNYGFMISGGTWYSQRRLAGFLEVVEGVAGRTCHISDENVKTSRSESIRAWIDALPKPIAIMTANDLLGCMAIQAAVELGLRVPDDVAVMGVDNNRWLTHIAPVSMTSVEVDYRQIGYRAVKLLDDLMAGRVTDPEPIWIPPLNVVTRRSTDIIVSEDPIVSNALRYMRDHFSEGITVEDILDHLGISRRNLENRLKRATGQTPHAALCQARIERAKVLLNATDNSMASIAQACGVEEHQFYTIFKRIEGITPGQYRRRSRSHDNSSSQ